MVLAIMLRSVRHVRLRAVWQNLVEDHGRDVQFEVALQDGVVMKLLVLRTAVALDHSEQVARTNGVLVRLGLLALAVDDRGDVLVDAAVVLKRNALLPPIA